MEKRKFDNKWRYLYALIIAVSLFIFGFSISYSMNLFEFQRASVLQDGIYYDFYKTQLKYNLFDSKNCDFSFIDKLGESLDFQGGMLEDFEQKFGKENPKLIERKKYYFLIELSHFEFIKKISEDCNFNITSVLFFYSNHEKDFSESERVGKILKYFKSNNPNVFIYSFDFNSPQDLVSDLKLKYNITEPVSVVVNEKEKLITLGNVNQLEKYLY